MVGEEYNPFNREKRSPFNFKRLQLRQQRSYSPNESTGPHKMSEDRYYVPYF